MAAERHEVKVTVLSQKGHCAWGHKVGDSWVIGGVTPHGMCLSALHSWRLRKKLLVEISLILSHNV